MSGGPGPVIASTHVTAVAPGKVILFGEHAINRGQPAIAAAVGLRAVCRAEFSADGQFSFRSGAREQRVGEDDLRRTWETLRNHFYHEDLVAIRALAAADYFAPQKYVLGSMFGGRFARPLALRWDSQVPSHSGLGSGGSAFVSMVAAVCALLLPGAGPEDRATWAHHGDEVAHGGIASALDTQTSLLGGVIRFTGRGMATKLSVAPGMTLVIGDTGVDAPTGEVNGRVRAWLEEKPTARMHVFRTVGTLAAAAGPALERGDWPALGRLMNLNQLVLEKIGVTIPQATRLIDAALDAGALGAKVSGSGGGGIIIALATPQTKTAIADAITAAGGKAMTPDVAVPGVHLEP